MSKAPIKLAAEIQARMQREAKSVLTMMWPAFYAEADIKRFHADKLGREIKDACAALGIVFGYGNHVVIFCLDTNFAA